VYWLQKRGLPATEEIVDRVFDRAKGSPTVLTEPEILGIINEASREGRPHA